MQRHQPHPIGEITARRDCHSSLTGRDRLVRIERKARYRRRVAAARSPVLAWRPTPGCREGMRGVFNDPEIVRGAEFAQCFEINHCAGDMDRNDSDYVYHAHASELAALGSSEFSL